MFPAIVSFLLGVAGWLAVNFVAKPWLDFLNLRSQVHEEVIFTGNIGQMVANTPIYDKAVDSLRRLGAKVQTTNITAFGPLRWYLSFRGYDLPQAGGGLMGLSNSLAEEDRGHYTDKIQVGMKLPREHLDEYLRQILQKKLQPPRS